LTASAATTTAAPLEIRISDEYEDFVAARLSDEGFRTLVDSIRTRTQIVPGMVNQHGIILDGHNRYRACAQLGIPFRYEVKHCKNKTEEILTIVEANGNRRHMTPFQRAELALRAKSELEKIAKENMSLGGKKVSRIQETLHVDKTLAEKAHTSKDTIYKTSQILQEAERNPADYAQLVKKLREGKSKSPSLDKTYNRIKKNREYAKKVEEVEAAAKGLNLPEKVTLLNMDSTNVEEITQIQDNSVDLLVTDPPYSMGSIELYEGLARFASQKLKDGGSLVFYYGNFLEPEIHKIFAKYEEQLTWWWRFCVKHEGVQSTRMHALGVRVNWKPMMWFVKGKKKMADWTSIDDFIQSTKPDKSAHPWAQSSTEAEYLIKNLTISKDSLVVDPFLGSGAFAIPAIKLGRYFVGIEIDEETFIRARNNLLLIKNMEAEA
jgi:DNA modification methylase